MTPHIHTVTVDFRAKTSDEMRWDDGETCEPFDFSDPLADMSPVEREQYEAEMSAYYRKESARLEKEWRQGETPNWKHRWEEAGGDIADFARDHSDTPAGADYIAKACGYHQTTWDDQRNVTRRAKTAASRRQDSRKVQQLQDNKVLHQSEPAKTEEKPTMQHKIQIQKVYEQAIASHPNRANKLRASLAFQLEQYEATVTRFVQRGKSIDEGAQFWFEAAKRACDAKISRS